MRSGTRRKFARTIVIITRSRATYASESHTSRGREVGREMAVIAVCTATRKYTVLCSLSDVVSAESFRKPLPQALQIRISGRQRAVLPMYLTYFWTRYFQSVQAFPRLRRLSYPDAVCALVNEMNIQSANAPGAKCNGYKKTLAKRYTRVYVSARERGHTYFTSKFDVAFSSFQFSLSLSLCPSSPPALVENVQFSLVMSKSNFPDEKSRARF